MDLDDYISLEHSAGTTVSSGQFTVDPTKLIEKLGQFLLEDDSQAVLKMVQGCIGTGADELWLVSNATDLTIYCSTPHATLLIQNLSEMFGKIFLGMGDSAERDLLLGICHFLNHHPESVGLSRWKYDRLETWTTLSGSQPERIRRYPKGMHTGAGIHIYLAAKGRKLVIKPENWSKRCFFAPIPIHSQGYLLGRSDEAPFNLPLGLLEYFQIGEDTNHGRIAPRWRGQAEVNIGHDLQWQSGDKDKTSPNMKMRCIGVPGDYSQIPRTFCPTSLGLIEGLINSHFGINLPYCRGVLYLNRPRGNRHEQCAIHAVKRGVVLDPIFVELPAPGALIYLASDDIATDLSTMKVHDDARPDLIHRALLLLKEGLEICQAHRDDLPVDVNWAEPHALFTVGGSVVLAIGLGLVTGFMPLIWPGALAAGYLGAKIEKLHSGPRKQAELIQELQNDIAAINGQLTKPQT